MAQYALAAVQAFSFESLAGAVALAGAIVLALLVVALGAFVYRSVAGDGIRWPDETDDEGVRRADGDDEWKYR